jgi:nitroreductase
MLKAATTEAGNWDVPPPARYQGDYKDRRRECGWQLYEAVGVIKGDRAGSAAQMLRNFRFFDAPHVAVVSTPKDLGAYGVLDCGAFVTGFMLAATALGIGSIAQAAVASYSDQVRQHFGIPEDRDIICGISFGYADTSDPVNGFRTARAMVDEVVDWR